jgi:thiamine biosynthesis lipoprotein
VGYKGLHLENGRAKLDRKGMAIELGAIAKGYAVDRAVALLKREGAYAALVEAGGDLRYFGRKPGNVPWRIAVQHPRKPDAYIKVDSPYESVATSGDYQRCIVVEGIRYHHILDPFTGYPAPGLASVSVWATTATEADILATAVFVMGVDQGMAFVEQRADTEALLFFEKNGTLTYRASSGLEGRIASMPPGVEEDTIPK